MAGRAAELASHAWVRLWVAPAARPASHRWDTAALGVGWERLRRGWGQSVHDYRAVLVASRGLLQSPDAEHVSAPNPVWFVG